MLYPVLKSTYDRFEALKGKRLAAVLVAAFIVCLGLGLLAGQLPLLLGLNESGPEVIAPTNATTEPSLVEREGKVVYSDPALHPEEDIYFKLIDSSGKDLILLKAEDDKLKIMEGSFARLRGTLTKTSDGKFDVLFVEQIVFK